jgi:hypothetical protein
MPIPPSSEKPVAPAAPVAPAEVTGQTTAPTTPVAPAEVTGQPAAPTTPAAPAAKKPMAKRTKTIIIIAVALLAIGAGVLIYRNIGASNARTAFTNAANEVVSADVSLTEIDDVVGSSSSLAYSTADAVDSAKNALSSASGSLDAATEDLATAQANEQFLDESGRSAVDALASSIQSRKEMLDSATKILDTASGAADASTDVLAAEGYASDARSSLGSAVSSANANDYSSSSSSASDAVNSAQTAVDKIAAAKEAYSGPDYSSYETYYAKLLEAAQIAGKIDDALLSGDYSTGNSYIDQYNDLRTELNDLSGSLPYGVLFISNYLDDACSDDIDAYNSSLDAMNKTDIVVNAYIASSGITLDTTDASGSNGYSSSTGSASTGVSV